MGFEFSFLIFFHE